MLVLLVRFKDFHVVSSLNWNFSDGAYKIYLYIRTSQNREFVFIAMLSISPMVRATWSGLHGPGYMVRAT
jgi:hypothetical protein